MMMKRLRTVAAIAWLLVPTACGTDTLENDLSGSSDRPPTQQAPAPTLTPTSTETLTETPTPTSTSTSTNDAPPASTDANANVVLYSKEYFQTHFSWHTGAAWMFHREFHECERFNQSCSFKNAINASRPLARFQVNSTIVDHLDWVEVQYDLGPGVMPAPKDFIAVYPVDEEAKEAFSSTQDHDFFDYSLLPTLNASEGKVTFGPLVNMRCSYQFRYIHYISPLNYEVLAASPHVEMSKGTTQPLQVHLALTGRSNEMRVMWTSGKVVQPQVLFGTSASNLSIQALAMSDSYKASDLCSANATSENASWYRHPGFLHDAVLTELQAGQTYFYKVGSSNGIWSDSFQFKMPPLAASLPDASKPQSFIVFGDLGPSILMEKDPDLPNEVAERMANANHNATYLHGVSHPAKSNTTMDLIEADILETTYEYLAVFHVGDLSYARGRTFQWDQFGSVIEPVASQVPYMVAIGNHEYDYLEGGAHDLSGAGATNGFHPVGGNYRNDSNGECGVPTLKRFHMPDNGNKVFWYSINIGLAHHVVISSEHNYTRGSPMYNWLQEDLTNHLDRARTPWVFLYLHRAMYCSQDYRPDWDVSLMIRQELEPLLQQFHVDAVFAGHYHSYERTCPVLQETCRSSPLDTDAENGDGTVVHKALGPVHLMIGSAGAALDDTKFKANISWSANAQLEYGYGRLHLFNESHALFEFFRIRGREVSDSYWIVSDHKW